MSTILNQQTSYMMGYKRHNQELRGQLFSKVYLFRALTSSEVQEITIGVRAHTKGPYRYLCIQNLIKLYVYSKNITQFSNKLNECIANWNSIRLLNKLNVFQVCYENF